MGKQLEIPATLFFWWLGIEVSFLPTMKNHHLNGDTGTRDWETKMNKVLVSFFVGAVLNFVEKIIIQLIAISFHLRTYADRIELNKFQISSLVKLYTYSKQKITVEDSEFEDKDASQPGSGTRTPMAYVNLAQRNAREAFSKVGDVAGKVAGDFTGKKVASSTHPHQVVLTLLNTTSGSQVLARRLYRTFVREDFDTVFAGDLKSAFDNEEEAEAAFSMFDKDMNGDISMEELEAVCVEIGRERKSITASLKDLDSVVSKLDDVFTFVVVVITLLVFLSLISTSAAGVLTSAGSTVLALSWLFSATAQEFLQSCIFVFVKHPFDVGDRVSVYGNTGSTLQGDDYFVKEIALLYTEFKKMEGHVVQAPNSYLNTLFILNMRRSGGLAEAVPITVKFGTSLEQLDELRQRLLEFVKNEKREYQGNILTELRQVTDAYSITMNIIFFYKSNWQNEGLRLQRRNKFICAMMVSMMEIGIEGPYMRVPGASEGAPFHLSHPFTAQANPTQPSEAPLQGPGQGPGPRSGSLQRHPKSTESLQAHGSILRKTTSNTTYRSRGAAHMAKHVDFSLGMKDMSSGDLMGDVYDDRSETRAQQYLRNNSPSQNQNSSPTTNTTNRISEEASGRSSGVSRGPGSRSGEPHAFGGLARAATDNSSRLRSSHRNRFFPRISSDRRRGGAEDDDAMSENLMEQGRLDPRSGRSGTNAVRDDSAERGGSGGRENLHYPAPWRADGTSGASDSQDFELRQIRGGNGN